MVRVNENEPPIPITEVTISNHRVSYEIKSYSDTDCYKMFHVDLFSGVVSTLVRITSVHFYCFYCFITTVLGRINDQMQKILEVLNVRPKMLTCQLPSLALSVEMETGKVQLNVDKSRFLKKELFKKLRLNILRVV